MNDFVNKNPVKNESLLLLKVKFRIKVSKKDKIFTHNSK